MKHRDWAALVLQLLGSGASCFTTLLFSMVKQGEQAWAWAPSAKNSITAINSRLSTQENNWLDFLCAPSCEINILLTWGWNNSPYIKYLFVLKKVVCKIFWLQGRGQAAQLHSLLPAALLPSGHEAEAATGALGSARPLTGLGPISC